MYPVCHLQWVYVLNVYGTVYVLYMCVYGCVLNSEMHEQVAHLMASADADKDGALSLEEIVSEKGREAFGSSLATDFGEAAQYHDEL